MWILTTTGMFSVVEYDEGQEAIAPQLPQGVSTQDALLVRARSEADLRAMLSASELPSSRATSTPHADYPWRAVLTRAEWLRYVSVETGRLDYPNFKARVLEVQGRERHDAYSRVWSILRSLETADTLDVADEPPEDPALW
jgi:hypothetical protein